MPVRPRTDVLTPQQRRFCMSRIRGKDTTPERVVCRVVRALGRRFRRHWADLPGKPDLVFPALRKVIFVHGCFWHMHRCRHGRVEPRTNAAFWRKKREGNAVRDRANRRKLRRLGWRVLTIWECWTRPDRADELAARVGRFLGRQESRRDR